MKAIEVIVLKGGVMAREVNPFGDKAPTDDVTYTKGNTVIYGKEKEHIHKAQLMNWERAEAKLRVFDIDSQDEALKNIGEPKITKSNPETKVELTSAHVLYEPNKKHKAIILPSGKIKLVPDKDSFYEKFAQHIDNTKVTDKFDFIYTNIGEPNFIKNDAKYSDKYNSVPLRAWTPEDLEAMAKFMRENPLCKLMSDGSGGDLN